MPELQNSSENKKQVLNLGFVSLFNDLSSEVITRVLPFYLLAVVHTTFVGLGFIEALTEATSTLGKLLSGYYSDQKAKRKPLIFIGYALSVFARPLILLQSSLFVVGSARFLEKMGKSIRTAPRDALIADLSEGKSRGRNFGINRALDTAGAVIGLTCVFLLLHFFPQDDASALKEILVGASGIGVFTLAILWFGVKEPAKKNFVKKKVVPLSWTSLDPRLRHYLIVAFFFAMANSSDAFIIVRGREMGFTLEKIFLVLIGFNLISAATAYKLTSLSDTWGRKSLLILGWALYAFAYFNLGRPHLSAEGFALTFLCYGLFYALTEGVEKALVADFETKNSKGQAYGWLGVIQGLGVIPANLIFAFLYQKKGALWAFSVSAALALFGVVLLLLLNTSSESLHEQ
jgi:MFS family permease